MNITIWIDIFGWAGALFVLLAYFMVSTRRYEGDSIAYQMLNILGGSFLIVNTLFYGAYPSSGVNLVWVGIAIYSIMARKKRSGTTGRTKGDETV